MRLYGRKWSASSQAFLQQYPLCVWCLVNGKYNQGAIDNARADRRGLVVDHIEPHRGNTDLFWDQDNWQTLCRTPCHDEVKQKHEAAGKTAEQWVERLKSVMYASKTRAMIEQARHHVPPRLATELAGGGRVKLQER